MKSVRPSTTHKMGQGHKESQDPKNIPLGLQASIRTTLDPADQDLGKGGKKKKCLICKQEWPSSFVEKQKLCDHSFCFECLNTYVNYKLMVGMELKCPCCDKIMGAGEWEYRLPDHLTKLYSSLKSFKEVKTHKKCTLQEDDDSCEGMLELKAGKYACNKCQKLFCNKCMFDKHEGTCQQNYKRLDPGLKRCPECYVFRAPNTRCTHFSCELEQQHCMVCFMGWSDKYFHECRVKDNQPPRKIWFRDSIMRSSWFLNILGGVVFAMLFPLVLVFSLLIIVVAQGLAIVLTATIAPFIVIYMACTEGVECETYLFFLCLPCGEAILIFQNSYALWTQYLSEIPGLLGTYLLTNKAMFYYTHPYRQEPSNYTPFKTTSLRRKLYLVVMIVLFPLLMVLPTLFFLLSSIFVFMFTLLSLPVIASKQKNIPIWVSVLFFPIVFFHFIAVDYVGKFLVGQLKEVYNFHKYYCITLCTYLACSDGSKPDDNSCAEHIEPEVPSLPPHD